MYFPPSNLYVLCIINLYNLRAQFLNIMVKTTLQVQCFFLRVSYLNYQMSTVLSELSPAIQQNTLPEFFHIIRVQILNAYYALRYQVCATMRMCSSQQRTQDLGIVGVRKVQIHVLKSKDFRFRLKTKAPCYLLGSQSALDLTGAGGWSTKILAIDPLSGEATL